MPRDTLVPAVSREKIMHAPYEAGEIEHCLMCTYRYAAFSLRDGEDEGLTADWEPRHYPSAVSGSRCPALWVERPIPSYGSVTASAPIDRKHHAT